MKRHSINDIRKGMILAEPIFLGNSDVELLAQGVEITERHISLMLRLGIEEVYVEPDMESYNHRVATIEEQAKFVEDEAKEMGEDFDATTFLKELEEIDEMELEPVIKNVANANMVINVLTGDGNIPIDKKHSDLVEHAEKAFLNIKTGDSLDIETIKEDINKALPDMIRNDDVLMRLSQLKRSDNYTYDHSIRVSILSTMIGKWLGYSHEQLAELAQAGLLFDIGKMKIPEFILNKPNKTRTEEFEIVKKHPQLGYNVLLKTKGVSSNVKFCALQHHERLDGSGYPLRLKEGQIHEFAKIVMVCDVIDAMTNRRPYSDSVSPFEAAEYLLWNSGREFDSKVIYILLKNLSAFYTGKDVLLSTDEKGRIVYVDVNYPTKPVVQVGDKFIDLSKEKYIKIKRLYN